MFFDWLCALSFIVAAQRRGDTAKPVDLTTAKLDIDLCTTRRAHMDDLKYLAQLDEGDKGIVRNKN